METSAFNVLVLAAFGLLILVSGGIAYLTVIEWRDRRRRENDRKQQSTIRGKTRRS
ncbi:MAG TPA: hypothetical protein IGS53_25350 [Leptolyngbyaceae cyanobacterium M33_DOE_097]|nr:hypothetical protein [Leptolyngbyaceae cyanobacterium M33_DOE_097]